jgi:hypothetical protein
MDSPIPGLSSLTRLIVSRRLAERSQEMLRAPGERGFEALVVWAGRWRDFELGIFDVELVIMPVQRGVRTEGGVAVVIDGDALFEMNVLLNAHGQRLVAQLHSHPDEAYHSETDDRYSVVTARGGLSLVVPNFAFGPFDLDSCALYRLEIGAAWVEVPPQEAALLIDIVEES